MLCGRPPSCYPFLHLKTLTEEVLAWGSAGTLRCQKMPWFVAGSSGSRARVGRCVDKKEVCVDKKEGCSTVAGPKGRWQWRKGTREPDWSPACGHPGSYWSRLVQSNARVVKVGCPVRGVEVANLCCDCRLVRTLAGRAGSRPGTERREREWKG